MKDSAVTENLSASERLDDDSTRLRQMRLRYIGMNYLQALANLGLLKGATTCNLKFGERCVLDKKKKVKFVTAIHHTGGLFYCVHINIWGLTKTASLGGHRYFVSVVNDYFRHC